MVAPRRPNPYTGPRPGARPGPRTVSAAQIYRRPAVISFLAVLHFFLGPLMLLGGLIAVAVSFSGEGSAERGLVMGVGAFYALFGILSIVCGIGLWNLKSYGRTIQLVYSFIGLLGIPVGTVISALILVYLFKPGVKVLFSETPPSQLSAADIAEVTRLSESSTMTVVLIAVAVLLMLVAFIGIIAAIAIPSLLRARVSANEAGAIGDLRTVVSAQAAYQASNRGFYEGRGECLSRPAECIPGYSGPSFLDPMTLTSPKNGYVRELRPGTPIEPGVTGVSPTSTNGFAIIAYPAVAGKTGIRSFCADASGRVCSMTGDASALVEEDAQAGGVRCSTSCN